MKNGIFMAILVIGLKSNEKFIKYLIIILFHFFIFFERKIYNHICCKIRNETLQNVLNDICIKKLIFSKDVSALLVKNFISS